MNPKGAIFSPDRSYRYQLWRIWTPKKPKVLFIGLNPSTAHELKDDPTITRCIGFAQKWGYGGMYMGNLFSLVSSLPDVLWRVTNPVEHEAGMTEKALREMAADSALRIAAWGALNILKDRTETVRQIIPGLYCLGMNRDGSPKHPLYLKADTLPIIFTQRTETCLAK